MKTASASVTDIGKVRDHNEDLFLALDDCSLYAVADGMGGHAAGEVASKLAIQTLIGYRKAIPREARADGSLDGVFTTIFNACHNTICDQMNERKSYGMGTTLTAAAIFGNVFHVAHVGDSAAYLVRADRATRVTDKQGAGHRLYNCLGSSKSAFRGVQHIPVRIVPGDLFVLATDGLLDYIHADTQLAEIVERAKSARSRASNEDVCKQIANDLVQHALNAGGADNVTVVVVRTE